MTFNKPLLIEPHLLGSLEYFSLISQFEKVKWEVHEHFVKQTYRNRYYLLAPSGEMKMTVPVKFDNRTPFKEVRIENRFKWQNEHLRAIQSYYGKAPFFEHVYPELEIVFLRKYEFLLDLVENTMTFCLKFLNKNVTIEFTDSFEKESEIVLIDARNVIVPKKGYDKRKFYKPETYIQNFGSEFVPNLSILDLIMCEGIRSMEIIRKSIIPLKEQI